MNNKKNNKSLIAFKCGLSSFLLYGIFLVIVIVMTIINLLIGSYNPVFDKIGIIVVCLLLVIAFISFILGLIAFRYSIMGGDSSNTTNSYFVKIGLFYGISIMAIWIFLAFSFLIYGLSFGYIVMAETKLIFYIILSIMSLVPLILHIRFRIKFGKDL